MPARWCSSEGSSPTLSHHQPANSYDITMAGVGATRLLAMAGLGGIALTGWALSHLGMARRGLTSGLTTFYVALYGVFMLALVLVGSGLRTGLLPGPAPFGVTVVPATFGGAVIVIALGIALLPDDMDRRVRALLPGRERTAGWSARAAAAGAAVSARVRGALRMLFRADRALLGALAWWGRRHCGCCGRASTRSASLPLPGGVGGVEGGMIAAFLAFGVPAGLAVVAVLSYRAFAFWLPTIPGVLSYLRLRHSVKRWVLAPRDEGP